MEGSVVGEEEGEGVDMSFEQTEEEERLPPLPPSKMETSSTSSTSSTGKPRNALILVHGNNGAGCDWDFVQNCLFEQTEDFLVVPNRDLTFYH